MQEQLSALNPIVEHPAIKPLTWVEIVAAAKNYNSDDNFRPDLLDKVPHPKGTLSVIGGATWTRKNNGVDKSCQRGFRGKQILYVYNA
jgi:hypothetical protein